MVRVLLGRNRERDTEECIIPSMEDSSDGVVERNRNERKEDRMPRVADPESEYGNQERKW